nr:DUF2188 domain-containing protein [Rugosibacter aromaticivorans]
MATRKIETELMTSDLFNHPAMERQNMGKNQHVVPRENGWAVRGEGNERDTSHHNTQAEAERAARGIAINQQAEVIIHGENGRIRERNSYGNDPFPPKG